MEQNRETILIDVREDEEVEISRPDIGEYVLHVPMSGILAQQGSIPPNNRLFVMCAHGIRSAQVTAWLTQQGLYSEVYNLDGGFARWINEGLPVVVKTG